MNIRKLLSLVLALLLALGTVALAEGDLQAQLDAANERIAQLEAEVEKYKPYYESQIVAEYGEGGIVWLADAQEEYQAASDAYAQYGLNIDDYAEDIKQDILESLTREAVLNDKSAELGLDQLDDAAMANLEAEAEQNFETYVESYKSYFAAEDATEEEAREQTVAAMAQHGLTLEVMKEQMVESYLDEQLYNFVTKDVAVTDEEVQAEYDQTVADDEEAYASDDYSYNTDRDNGETIAWNPEGYRAVKHVLIQFDDDQSSQYSDLKSTLDSLEDEKEAVENPAEDKEAAADGEEAATEDKEAAPARSLEEIDADIAKVTAEIEALYAQLLPQAQQVIDEFNAGADFDSLIEKYNSDPGMTNEPTATIGYAVSANSTTWDPAFTEGAMSIAEVGQISAPVYGMYGIHIIYYMNDITPGPVPFEEIADAIRASALEAKTSDTYDAQVTAWMEEAAPVYHLDRF